MTPLHWIMIIIGIGYFVLDFKKFEKDPEQYAKKKKKFLRSPSNPVASNAELFDAFGYKPELKEKETTQEPEN